jgi:hypothetical protein
MQRRRVADAPLEERSHEGDHTRIDRHEAGVVEVDARRRRNAIESF